jgi:hypothetical protein
MLFTGQAVRGTDSEKKNKLSWLFGLVAMTVNPTRPLVRSYF